MMENGMNIFAVTASIIIIVVLIYYFFDCYNVGEKITQKYRSRKYAKVAKKTIRMWIEFQNKAIQDEFVEEDEMTLREKKIFIYERVIQFENAYQALECLDDLVKDCFEQYVQLSNKEKEDFNMYQSDIMEIRNKIRAIQNNLAAETKS